MAEIVSDRSTGYAMRGRQGEIIDAIGRQIISGRYRPGDLMPREAELTEEHEASRTSIREAMRVLAAKGLVDIRQKVGTRVRPQDLWNVFDTDILRWHSDVGLGEVVMRDLVEVRQVMEPAAARLAAGRAGMADLRRIADALRTMDASTDSVEAYAHADVEFHLAVYAATHNVLMRQFGNVIADFMYLTFTIQQEVADPAGLVDDVASHAEIYRAIDRGEGEKAAEAMLDAVLEGKSSLIAALGGEHERRPGSDTT
ncbi:FadR/GntR family transcriptional regulator [Homoserinibacter sp. GY 40078]|uniref:FadR/GntR family transcriptional regulator n=1 Tax=Homoserinibacter sp. GY 40078 TaxID=2603275 RepID=UPI0011C8FC07|nr:FadR/GntR family transcriptional regulator [Homoserinibacter sp. GY 40078]TXK18776.1 FadR family transcriptional regulator [Homoserinibacter sp. GY 40078]